MMITSSRSKGAKIEANCDLDLPREVWEKIMLEHTTSMREFVCLSAVQRSWKAFVKAMIPQGIPWLVLKPWSQVEKQDPDCDYSTLYCLNLLDRQVYEFQLTNKKDEDVIDDALIRSWKGEIDYITDRWAISMNNWMFNPFTKDLFPLKDDDVEAMLQVAYSKGLGEGAMGSYLLYILAFHRMQRSHKTRIWVDDLIFFKGCVYQLSDSTIWISDLNHQSTAKPKHIDLKGYSFSPVTHGLISSVMRRYLVELDGDLLLVILRRCDPETPVILFKLDFDQVKWDRDSESNSKAGELHIDIKDRVLDIKGYAMVIGRLCSKSLIVTDFMSPSIRRNCIYAVDLHHILLDEPYHYVDMWVYSLEDGSKEPLLSDDVADKFFVPCSPKWLMSSMFGEDALGPELRGMYNGHGQLNAVKLEEIINNIGDCS